MKTAVAALLPVGIPPGVLPIPFREPFPWWCKRSSSFECGRVAMNGRRRRLIIIRYYSEWTANCGRGWCWPGTDVKRNAGSGLACTVRDTAFGLGMGREAWLFLNTSAARYY